MSDNQPRNTSEVDVAVEVDSFEEIFATVGDAGRWQLMMVLLTSYTAFVAAVDTFSLVFKMDEPIHWCVTASASEQTTPCGTQGGCHCLLDGNSTAPCSHWQFDDSVYGSTVVTAFQLVCQRSALRSLAVSVHMVSGLAASMLFGFLGDRLGRARAGCVCVLLFLGAGFVQAASRHVTVYLLVSTVTAGAHMGMYCCWYTYCVETVADRWRSFAGIFWLLPWASGISSVALAAWQLREWWELQLFVAAAGLPLLLCGLLPESPRWLLETGRVDRAMLALRHIARANGRALSAHQIDSLQRRLHALAPRKQPSDSPGLCRGISPLFGGRQMRIRSLATIWIWMSIAIVYYGVAFDSTQLADNGYLALGLSGLVELPGMASVWLINRWGRRPIMAATYILTAAAMLPIPLVPRGWPVLALGLVSKLVISAGFGIIYIYVEEYFPTCVRSAALGLASTSEAAGGAIAPYISFSLSKIHWSLPSVVFCAVALSAGLVVILALPETLGKTLPATIAHVEGKSTPPFSSSAPETILALHSTPESPP